MFLFGARAPPLFFVNITPSCVGCSAWLVTCCFGCVFFTLEPGGVDSAPARVALLDTNPLPLQLGDGRPALSFFCWLGACLTRVRTDGEPITAVSHKRKSFFLCGDSCCDATRPTKKTIRKRSGGRLRADQELEKPSNFPSHSGKKDVRKRYVRVPNKNGGSTRPTMAVGGIIHCHP